LQTAESAASSHSLKTDNSRPESSERDEEDDKEEESEKSTSEEEFQEVQEALGQSIVESPIEEQSPETKPINIDLPSPSTVTHPNPIFPPTLITMTTPAGTAAAAAPTGSPKELRVNTPTPFEGDRSKLRTFLLDCKLYLAINREIYDHDDKKIAFVLSYLTGGDASMWKNQWLQSKQTGANLNLGTYAAFFTDLTDAFKEEEQAQNALHKIHNLQQSKNMLVEELNTEFRLLVGRAGLTMPTTAVAPAPTIGIDSNETLLIDAYRRALNPKSCTRILMGETTP